MYNRLYPFKNRTRAIIFRYKNNQSTGYQGARHGNDDDARSTVHVRYHDNHWQYNISSFWCRDKSDKQFKNAGDFTPSLTFVKTHKNPTSCQVAMTMAPVPHVTSLGQHSMTTKH